MGPKVDGDRVKERAEAVDERLEHIPDGQTMPDLEDMTIGSAKEFRLGIVFLDIASFTDYSGSNDDEDVLFMLNVLVPELMELARDRDGIFEKNTGDGIMVYFGAGEIDISIADDVIHYLTDVRTALRKHVNPCLKSYGVDPVALKAGATLGSTYISRIGINRLNRRTAVSIAANVASKLENRAKGGEFLVGSVFNKLGRNGNRDWAQYLERRGTLPGYTWDDRPFRYYDYTANWV
jgi:class 3 adenylate cyclase